MILLSVVPVAPGHKVTLNVTSNFEAREMFIRFHMLAAPVCRIPKMGGKDLDLHVLYVEVTQRGGLQQVLLSETSFHSPFVSCSVLTHLFLDSS